MEENQFLDVTHNHAGKVSASSDIVLAFNQSVFHRKYNERSFLAIKRNGYGKAILIGIQLHETRIRMVIEKHFDVI